VRDPECARQTADGDDAVVVRVRGLVVGYAGAPVAAAATFDVARGEVVALVGPNGCGKSTVLRTVLGRLEPLAGEVELLGAPVDERLAHVRAAVAAVLDDDAWFPALTVREHLYLTARGHGVLGADDVVADVLDELGLAAVAHALPTSLSSGQRRRLLLASALVRPRELLVLDEPEQRLDRAARELVERRIRDEAADGGAVLLATHDAALVRAVATSVVQPADDIVRVLSADEGAALIARVGA